MHVVCRDFLGWGVEIACLISFPILTGVDPKSLFCAFYKQGLCKKGAKCKFSHDPAVERKSAKKDLYTDSRAEKEEEGMEDWDEDQLNDVIQKKHGGERQNQTDIVRRRRHWWPCCFLLTPNSPIFRSASTSWMRWRTTSTGGSGSVPTGATTACTATRCRPGSCSRGTRRRRRRRTRSRWRSS